MLSPLKTAVILFICLSVCLSSAYHSACLCVYVDPPHPDSVHVECGPPQPLLLPGHDGWGRCHSGGS